MDRVHEVHTITIFYNILSLALFSGMFHLGFIFHTPPPLIILYTLTILANDPFKHRKFSKLFQLDFYRSVCFA